MNVRVSISSLVLSLAALPVAAQTLAATPPMGWNSWDSYGLTINEQQFRDNTAVLRDKLLSAGWRYAVIDEGWFFPNPGDRPHPERLQYALDTYGRFVPDVVRFPSASGNIAPTRNGQSVLYTDNLGLAPVAAWVHAQHLLFGIHIVRGIPREAVRLNLPVEHTDFHATDAADTSEACPWDPTMWGVRDNAAGQAWYDALIAQYAAWGVDFLKVDCIADHPYRSSEIRQIHAAIQKSGRPMVLSLSPGPTNLMHASEVTELAQMWRISDDVWDVWKTQARGPQTVESQFARLAAWTQETRPGNWPDADMLPFGELRPKPDVGPGGRKSRLTPAEQRTQFSLWAIARSPLILGANLTLLDARTLQLVTNPQIIRINQTALASRQALRESALVAWTADLPVNGHALALFNLGDTPLRVSHPLANYGLPKNVVLHDAFTGKVVGANGVDITLPPHGSAVFVTR